MNLQARTSSPAGIFQHCGNHSPQGIEPSPPDRLPVLVRFSPLPWWDLAAGHGQDQQVVGIRTTRVTGFMKETRLDSERRSALALQSPNGLRLT